MKPDADIRFRPACPVPRGESERILLAHGEGGRLTRQLIRRELVPAFGHPALEALGDAAVLPGLNRPLVVSTDSYVVTPLFFPGGDIGSLAVHGTVNDLAVAGAEPLYLCLGLILEEGLPLDTLRRIIASTSRAAENCQVAVVAGDTKVVPRGAADAVFIHTTGVGSLRPDAALSPRTVQVGDAVLVSGTIGDHGMAILCAREELAFESPIESDSAPVTELVSALFRAGVRVRWMRDPTRGGMAAALHELADAAAITIEIDDDALPVSPAVRGASELLGLDPIFVANEGKVLAVVAESDADRALAEWQRCRGGSRAALIGRIAATGRAEVLIRTPLGGLRVLDEPAGAPLPRIC
jgi:hydrogenase expression/formation protein HypE